METKPSTSQHVHSAKCMTLSQRIRNMQAKLHLVLKMIQDKGKGKGRIILVL